MITILAVIYAAIAIYLYLVTVTSDLVGDSMLEIIRAHATYIAYSVVWPVYMLVSAAEKHGEE